MEFRQLEYVLAVAEAGSFSAAAQALHMTQPPLSTAVGQLERELGSRLFTRNARGVTLTATGEHVVREARVLLDRRDALRHSTQVLEQGFAGTVTVATVPTCAWELAPVVIREYAESAPGVEIVLRERTPTEVLDGVKSGAFDVGLVATPSTERLQAAHEPALRMQRVQHLKIIALLPGSFADAPDPLPLDMLADQVVAVPERTLRLRGIGDSLVTAFENAGLPLPRMLHVMTLQEALPLVIAGRAVAVAPEPIRAFAQMNGLTTRRLAGDLPDSEAAVVWRPRADHSQAVRSFIDVACRPR